MNIILGMSGSVASKLAPKLLKKLSNIGDTKLVITSFVKNFIPKDISYLSTEDEVFEWNQSGSVLHIDLEHETDILVLAPLGANTLAKLVAGIADDLLTNIIRAWDVNKPIIIAPAMNPNMWNHPLTAEHLEKLKRIYKNITIIEPVEKTLVCGDTGIGAMGHIDDILESVKYYKNKMNS